MITHVAVRFQGVVYSLPSPNRHHHVLWKIIQEAKVPRVNATGEDQGFLDDAGNYLTRTAALEHAVQCNQLKDPKEPFARSTKPQLFSEDVW